MDERIKVYFVGLFVSDDSDVVCMYVLILVMYIQNSKFLIILYVHKTCELLRDIEYTQIEFFHSCCVFFLKKKTEFLCALRDGGFYEWVIRVYLALNEVVPVLGRFESIETFAIWSLKWSKNGLFLGQLRRKPVNLLDSQFFWNNFW